MLNFVICCSQGMSSSALVKRMKDYVNENGLNIEIKATTADSVYAGNVPFDVLLLGPQIRFEKNKLQEKFPKKVIEVINMRDYGRLDGEAVVKTGMDLFDRYGKL